ncbi:MAG: aldehyde ferredoxin oxidoreductase family protein [Candidatus Thorarchaeota archaeon]
MEHGWNRKILWIDLGSRIIREEKLEADILERFLGGKGLGAYLLYKNLEKGIAPLDPDNIFILLSGPLQGLPAPNVGRWSIVTKSPLTGIFLDSHCGGPTGREIKKAGYDAVCITGRASSPVVITIDDDSTVINDATSYWGKGIYEVTHLLHDRYGDDFSVYTIGPAGEQKVLFATASCEIAHQTGRGGAGAVLGSKNIKSILVRGTKEIASSDVQAIKAVNKEFTQQWRSLDIDFKKYGTRHLVEIANVYGQFPTRNWQNGFFDQYEDLSHLRMEEYGLGNNNSCPHCVMRCTHAFRTADPRDLTKEVESTVEYESIGLLGGNLAISNPMEVLQLNYLCDDLGLDTISSGSVIGFAIEAFEKGILSQKEVGFHLRFGDFICAAKLLQMISSRTGIGDVLAEGVRFAASKFGHGAESFAVHVKGMEVPAWDPRGRMGQGILYATGDIGASHLRGWPPTSNAPDSSAIEFVEKLLPGRIEKIIKDCLVICHFTNRIPITMDQMRRMLNGATGMNYSLRDLDETAMRIETLIRLFNVREGITRNDDILPPRFWEPQSHGPREGMRSFISNEDFEASISRYYDLMGWDSKGVPTDETMESLGLLNL